MSKPNFTNWRYWYEQWDERAGILEFDSGLNLSREESEEKAFRQLKEQYTVQYKLPYYGSESPFHQIQSTENKRSRLVNKLKKIHRRMLIKSKL